MASYTENLNLLKKNPLTDGSDTFNIETMLNENWDKIDAFAGLAANPAELWVWEKFNGTFASYHDGETHTNEDIVRNDDSASGDIFYYSDSISVDVSGAVILTNPSELYLSYDNYSSASVLKGKYIKKESDSQVAFIPTTATFSRGTTKRYFFVNASTVKYIDGVAAVLSHVEYVSSPDSSTYPENGQSGNYWYTRLGQIGKGMTKIETGSYVGTGTYGSSNPNSVTFGFKPKIIFWFLTDDVTNGHALNYDSYYNVITPIEFFTTEYKAYKKPYLNYDNPASGCAKISMDGKTISWYDTESASRQHNTSGIQYYCVAIG